MLRAFFLILGLVVTAPVWSADLGFSVDGGANDTYYYGSRPNYYYGPYYGGAYGPSYYSPPNYYYRPYYYSNGSYHSYNTYRPYLRNENRPYRNLRPWRR